MSRAEKEFEKIANDVVNKCSAVPCSKAEYADGLGTVISYLESSLDAVRDELKKEEEAGGGEES